MWISTTYNKFKKLQQKLEISKNDMSSLIREEYDTLNSISSIISEISKDEEPFKDLKKLKDDDLSNFEMDRQLKEYVAEYQKYKEKLSDDFYNNENLIKLNEKLEETLEFIKGTEEYYNESVIEYNKKITMFPSIIISKLTFQKKQDLYEDLDNDFKL